MKKILPVVLLLQIVLPLLAGTVTASPCPVPKPYAESPNPTFPRIEVLAERVTAAPPAPARRSPQPQAVETLISDNLTQGAWRYGGGFIYWTNNCGGWIDPVSAYFKRRAETGQIVQVLDQPADCEVLSSNLVADEEGVFYRNFRDQDLEARLTDDPGTIIKLADVSDTYPWSFATDEFFVYYTQPDGIYWAFKLGPVDQQVSDATNVTSLAVDDTYIYWLDDTGLWRSDKTCSTPTCWSNKEQLSANPGKNLSWQGTTRLYWVGSDVSNWYIYYRTLGIPGTFTAYNSPKTTTLNIGHAIVAHDHLFWLEKFVGNDVVLHRRSISGGPVETIADGLDPYTDLDYIAAGSRGVIFNDEAGIYRVPFDETPVTKDLSVDDMEVTQGIQNLDNEVPLVADKTTYVRVYGSIVTQTNPANTVQVQLHGYRGSSELPGSPLQPLNGPQALAYGVALSRGDPEDGWLFQLPAAWKEPGTLQLKAVIDPRGIYNDDNPGNDELTEDLVFYSRPPACLVFVPVRTEAGTENISNPHFGPMLDLYQRLWPLSRVHVFEQSSPVEELEVCLCLIFPCPCYGPYELTDQGNWIEQADKDKVLSSLYMRNVFTDDPDVCDDAGGRTHYVGVVRSTSNTGSTIGYGYVDGDELWVKFPSRDEQPPSENTWQWPGAGPTLAHELGHNYNRRHVKCPVSGNNVPPNTDPGYIYSDTCKLDDGDPAAPSTHYGFDVDSLTPIRPDTTADFMSYSRPVWSSDYTYEALFNKMSLEQAGDVPTDPERPDLAQADSVVFVSGYLTSSQNLGHLDTAWVLPTTTLSAGLLRKWQDLAVPSVGGIAQPAGYHLRLLDAQGAILDDRTLTTTKIYDVAVLSHEPFMAAFPAPAAPVARLELMIDSTVVDSLAPGASVPSVQILQPAGGETFDAAMTVVWEATDADGADDLLYTVQYSPDQGAHWYALVANLPGLWRSDRMTLTLDDLSDIPGSSTGGLLRVTASDGYNTGLDTSNLFQVSNRPPRPYIISPVSNQWVGAGQTALFRGGANDVEDGALGDADLAWAVEGSPAGTGEEVAVQGLAPGTHQVVLTAQDSGGETTAAQASLNIAPVYVAPADGTLELDGVCDDAAYADAVAVQLSPYAGGGQGMARLTRTDTDLWVCFGGMDKGSGGPTAFAGVRVDGNYSRDPLAQSSDHGFFVREDGTPFTRAGDGAGGFDEPGPGGLDSRISVNDTVWNAELRIDYNVLGNWDHVVGLALGHYGVRFQGDDYQWPYDAGSAQPATWATTVLGQWPQLESVLPEEATAGDEDIVIFVEGDHFVDGAVILWNGVPQATGFWTEHFVSAIIAAADLAQAGLVTVTVVNPGLEAAPSNPLLFTIMNPTPTISALSPVSATAGGADFVLTVDGADLIDGAVVMWDGQARPTSFVNGTRLTAQIDAADIAMDRTVGVLVLNPEPAHAASAPAPFEVKFELYLPYSIYLPLLYRHAVGP